MPHSQGLQDCVKRDPSFPKENRLFKLGSGRLGRFPLSRLCKNSAYCGQFEFTSSGHRPRRAAATDAPPAFLPQIP